MNKQFLIFVGIGVLAMGFFVFGIMTRNQGAHLELRGEVMKARQGALDDLSSVAVLDFRIENPSDVKFVVRQVKVTLKKADGSDMEGEVTAKSNLAQLFAYNKFLGQQYNDALTIQDVVPPRGKIDRMVAARFSAPLKDLEGGKALVMWIEDLDGASFETTYPLR